MAAAAAPARSASVPASWLLVPMLVMLVSGACNTILMKLMSRQVVAPGPGMEPHNFYYPTFQTVVMLLGMLLCLAVYFILHARTVAPVENPIPKSLLVVPALLDCTATTCIHAAYVIIPASTIQMCRGSVVVFTALLSVVFLGRRQAAHQIVGVALVTCGLVVVAINAVMYGVHESTYDIPQSVGVLLCGVGEVFVAGKLVLEQRYFETYASLHPLELVGFEGLFGVGMVAVILVFLQYWNIERTSEAVYMVQHSGWVLFACCAAACSIAIFNWAGATVTQRSSAVTRSVIDVSRTVLIWIAELVLAWNAFSMLQLFGFIVLTTGTLVYNSILPLPYQLGMSAESTALLEKKAKAEV